MTAPLTFVNATGNVSGAEEVLLELVDLAMQRGHATTVAAPPGPLAARLPEGVRHVPLPPLVLATGDGTSSRAIDAVGMTVRWLRAAATLRPLVREPNTRVIVNSLLALPAARLARPAGGVRWLVHDTLHRKQQRLVVRAARSSLRVVVAVSEASAAPLRVAGLPVTVVGHGVAWPVDPADVSVGVPPTIGCLALLTPWKGQTVLLDAIAQLPGVQVELAGGAFSTDAAYVRTLHRRAAAPDLAGRVRFLGHVDALETMRGWDVAVSASTDPEAGPLSALEAMSLGVPVVGTDHGGTRTLLAGGVGLLVAPGDPAALRDALSQALNDAAFRRRSFDLARRTIAEHHDRRKTLPTMFENLVAE